MKKRLFTYVIKRKNTRKFWYYYGIRELKLSGFLNIQPDLKWLKKYGSQAI